MLGCMNLTTPAARRYARRMVFAMCFYLLFIFGSVSIFAYHHPTGSLSYVFAVLPALPILGMIAIFGLYLKEEKDEVQRAIGVEALLWGIGTTLALTTVWGFWRTLCMCPISI